MRMIVHLQIPTIFWTNGSIISQVLNIYAINDIRQTEMHTSVPLFPGHSFSRFKLLMKIWKCINHQVLIKFRAELIQAGGNTLSFKIQKLINSTWNEEELSQQWKESITVPIYKKGDKTDCGYYIRISLLPTAYKILSNILASSLNPNAEEITGYHQCEFRHNISAADQIFYIRQILEEMRR
jgi:hypothetical protein